MSAARVSFYVLGGTEPNTRLGYACRLVEKAYKLQNRIHAHTGDANMAKVLDTLLWTFRQGSFVPHELLSSGQPADGAGHDRHCRNHGTARRRPVDQSCQ
jgi:DNA polymerase-3 subunit chi